eukprot:SAG11_NODE_18327_length_494_cov_0.908861_1_plen_68_part_00
MSHETCSYFRKRKKAEEVEQENAEAKDEAVEAERMHTHLIKPTTITTIEAAVVAAIEAAVITAVVAT